jgi:hypothetical protein
LTPCVENKHQPLVYLKLDARTKTRSALRIASESFPFNNREQVAKRKRDFYLCIFTSTACFFTFALVLDGEEE